MRTRISLIAALAALPVLLTASLVSGQTLFEALVLPGPVVTGHAKVENDCIQCHEKGSRKSQPKLCLVCHKDVAADLAASRGYHGRDRLAASQDCKHCHTDHKGRTADIVPFDRETFNHALTNFPLKGGHSSARCESCHAVNTKYRKAPGACIECHRAADPHKGNLGTKCEGCHNETAWRQTTAFDHAKTKFPLTGAHKDVVCTSCHAGEHYKGLGVTCISCHSAQDKHAGRYGQKCETCHAPKKWADISFDHTKATKFPLRGKHASVACDACHTGDLYKVKLPTTCFGCHGKSDPHKGQLGNKCETCHKETGWRQKVAFDHDVTRFPLVGLHKAVACEDCHTSERYKETPQACAACHKDAHHEGRLGDQCALCHTPNGWTRWHFDHARQTRFALTGAHDGLDCHACHKAKGAARPRLSTTCIGCHAADDAHSGSFGIACEQCHDTTSFKKRGSAP